MEFDNKTMVILGLIIIAIGAMYVGHNNLALAIGSGLVGYLSKDASITLNQHPTEEKEAEDDTDDI